MTDLNATAWVKKRINGRPVLLPADWRAEEWFQTIKDNAEVLMKGRKPRNPKHHRLLWAALKLTSENVSNPAFRNPVHLLDALKLATGLSEQRISCVTGEVFLVPKSISFAAMDQDAFSAWFDIAIDVLANDVLQCEPQWLLDAIMEMVNSPDPLAS